MTARKRSTVRRRTLAAAASDARAAEDATTDGATDLLAVIPASALAAVLAELPDPPRGLERASGQKIRAVARRRLPADVIGQLFEQWRYGQRVSFTLALLLKRPEVSAPELADGFRAELERLIPADATPEQRKASLKVVGEFALEQGDMTEIAFRYGRTFNYLDLDEREQTVTESRYGFFWLDPREQFVAVTGEGRIVDSVLLALERTLTQRPIRVAFDRTVVDDNFPPETVWSISNIDLRTGFRFRTSGEGLATDLKTYEEVMARDRATVRERALYADRTEDGKAIRAYVNVLAGKLITTMQLPASALRAWAGPKLRQVARSQRELQKAQPARFYARSTALTLPGVPRKYADAVRHLVAALFECRDRGVRQLNLLTTAAALMRALPPEAVRITIRAQCEMCGGMVEAHCESCSSPDFIEAGAAVICARDPAHTGATCAAGHEISADQLREGLTLEPLRLLWEWMSIGLNELKEEDAFDPTTETLIVRDDTLMYQQAPLGSGRYFCLAADVEGSTPLRKTDEQTFRKLMRAVLDSARAHGQAQGARTLRDGGDGMVLLFDAPAPAVAAARAIRDEIAASPDNPTRARLRFAIAPGEVTTSGRLDGLVFHYLARLEKTAIRGSRIAVDQQVLLALRPADREDAIMGAAKELRDFSERPYFHLRN